MVSFTWSAVTLNTACFHARLWWSSTFSTLRVKSMHDLAQRALQEYNVVLSLLRSLPCSQQQCHAICESSSCHVLRFFWHFLCGLLLLFHVTPCLADFFIVSTPLLRPSPLSSLHAPPHAAIWLLYAYSAKLYIHMHDLAQRIVKLKILNTTCEIHARPCAANSSSV